ncbi:MAG: hypothetical protein OHK0035_30920 [Cyanobacteria bacterium J069]
MSMNFSKLEHDPEPDLEPYLELCYELYCELYLEQIDSDLLDAIDLDDGITKNLRSRKLPMP